MGLFRLLDTLFAQGAIGLIRLYQATISPDKGLFSSLFAGTVCVHEPHCSAYARTCYQRYGFVRGTNFTIERVMSCTPSNQKTYDPAFYRVVFASGSPIGVPFLKKIVDDPRFELAGVMTAPDKPVGRGQKTQPNPIKTAAQDYLDPEQIITPHSLRLDSKNYADEAQVAHDRLQRIDPDFLVVVAYGKILPQPILDMPRIGPVNVHGSLLPSYRGASPLQAAFLNEDEATGLTIMRMEAEIDTGPVLSKKQVELPFDWTVRDLIGWMKDRGPGLLTDTMRGRAKGAIRAQPQDDTAASYYGKIEKEAGKIDPSTDTLQEIYAKWRAFALWPKIYWFHEDQRVIIEELVLNQEQFQQHKTAPLLRDDQTLNPAVTTLLVKPEGKQTIDREEFQHGYLQ